MHQICPADCGRYGTGQPDLLPKALIHAEGMNDIACMIEKVQLPVLCSVGSNENIMPLSRYGRYGEVLLLSVLSSSQ